MKIAGLTFTFKNIGLILTSILLGGLIGWILEFRSQNPRTILTCAIGAGIVGFWNLRKKEKAAIDKKQ